MKKQNIFSLLKLIGILTLAIIATAILVGLIAYSNCEDAKLFIDNLMGRTINTGLGQV